MIPKDAAEIYCDEKGNPIAYAPAGSLTAEQLFCISRRVGFFNLNKERVFQLVDRAEELQKKEGPTVVVCINVDDVLGNSLADVLMPNNEAQWASFRAEGMTPVALGIAKREGMDEFVKSVFPNAGPLSDEKMNIIVVEAAGVSIFHKEDGACPTVPMPKSSKNDSQG